MAPYVRQIRRGRHVPRQTGSALSRLSSNCVMAASLDIHYSRLSYSGHVCATIQQVSLPSAADLFDSVDADTASFMSAPPGGAGADAEMPLTTPKRKNEATDGEGAGNSINSGNKKSKQAQVVGGKKAAEPSRGLVPPQMSRPNIVTEDTRLWSSDATLKRQRQMAELGKGKSKGGAAGEGTDAAKGGKDSKTFKQREKVKTKRTQQPRCVSCNV